MTHPCRHEGFVDLPDVRLYYALTEPAQHAPTGADVPLVFLHGGGLDSRMWDAQIAAFAEHTPTLSYDMRAAGRSETLPRTDPYVPYQDLADLLIALAIPRATLIGLSLGARVAIDFAIAYPERVARLVLVSPGLSGYQFTDPWTAEQFGTIGTAAARGDLATVVETFVRLWTDGPYRQPEQVDPGIRAQIAAMAARTLPMSALARAMQELEPPAIGRLDAITAPTLIVRGDQDTSDIAAIGTLLHTQIPGAQQVIMPDVGHTLVMEQPDRFTALLAQFLTHGTSDPAGERR
jgi:3-oxoadipate enol-lactonase